MAHARALCKRHYRQWRDGIDVAGIEKRIPQLAQHCSFVGCERVAVAKGLCDPHRTQAKRGDLFPIGRRSRRSKYRIEVCAIAGCANPHYANAMCARHSSRASTYRLTAVQYQMLLLVDKCGICHDPLADGNRAIDHDHSCCPGEGSCGECIRGVLCKKCNAGIGYFDNRAELLLSAVDYLS